MTTPTNQAAAKPMSHEQAIAVLTKWADTEEGRCNHRHGAAKCSVCCERRDAIAALLRQGEGQPAQPETGGAVDADHPSAEEVTARGEALGRVLAHGRALVERDKRRAIATWNAELRELMARQPEDDFVKLCHDGQPCPYLYATPPSQPAQGVVTETMVDRYIAVAYPMLLPPYAKSRRNEVRIGLTAALTPEPTK